MKMTVAAGIVVCAVSQCAPAQEKYAGEAEALREIATTDGARAWLDEAARLPEVEPRTIHYRRTREGNAAYTAEAFAALDEEEREGLRELTCSAESRYYETFYGTPLAYLRAIDLAVAALGDEEFSWSGTRVLDIGYGQIGQLRMLAQAGADAIGVDPDPILEAMYSQPGDTGDVEGGGSVAVYCGVWPGDDDVRESVGGDYDIILMRNLYKRGYIDPPQETPAYQQVDFGVSDESFLRLLRESLRPGGVLVVYSLGGTYHPPGESYNASSDIANPWDRDIWEGMEFEIVAHDASEDEKAREVGRRLGWDERGMDLENGLFGVYSIYRRAN